MENLWPLEQAADAFYGNPRAHGGGYDIDWARDHLVHVQCPWQLHMGLHQPVPFITIHAQCADSLTRVLAQVWAAIGKSQEAANGRGYSVFSGSFNFRPIRGSAQISMHAYGAAIDWDAPDNPMGYGNLHHRFTDSDPLIAAFKAEGWRWGGDYCSRHDYMHVEACR
jgi:hypothetical protein